MPGQIAYLKNGSVESKDAVDSTLFALENLKGITNRGMDGSLAIFELNALCKNPQHSPYGTTGDILKEYAFLDKNGQVHDTVRNVVLSAVTEEGVILKVGDPYKPQPVTHSSGMLTSEQKPLSPLVRGTLGLATAVGAVGYGAYRAGGTLSLAKAVGAVAAVAAVGYGVSRVIGNRGTSADAAMDLPTTTSQSQRQAHGHGH
jgi:hypothetical protein